MVKDWKVRMSNSQYTVPYQNLFRGIIFGITSVFFVTWRHSFNKFDKKRNAHRFWTIIAIKTVDSSSERYLITNFKNRQFIDLRAPNFADITVLKNKISTMWLRWWRRGILVLHTSKIFQLKYFWFSFRKSLKVSAQT